MRKSRGEITKLSTLFDKYKKVLKAPQKSVIEAFVEVASELLGVELQKSKVTYNVRTRILFTNFQGPIKSEIKLHKKEIINHLKGRLGEQSAPIDIT